MTLSPHFSTERASSVAASNVLQEPLKKILQVFIQIVIYLKYRIMIDFNLVSLFTFNVKGNVFRIKYIILKCLKRINIL